MTTMLPIYDHALATRYAALVERHLPSVSAIQAGACLLVKATGKVSYSGYISLRAMRDSLAPVEYVRATIASWANGMI